MPHTVLQAWIIVVALGVVGALLCVAVGLEPCSAKPFTADFQDGKTTGCFEFWVNRYQTLIGAIVAVLAAGVALHAVRLQIAASERLEMQRRHRANEAARITMPFALSSVAAYAMNLMHFYRLLRDIPMQERGTPDAPPFPDDTIAPLRGAAEHAAPSVVREIADLLSAMQIVKARTDDRKMMTTDIDQSLFDAADLYARSARLFDYARDNPNDQFAKADAIRQGLRLVGINGEALEEWWPITKMRIETRALRAGDTRLD